MRIAGKPAADTLEMIEPHIKAGVTTDELNQICHDYVLERGAYSAPLDYHGSLNQSVRQSTTSFVTAFQRSRRYANGQMKPAILKDGDIINVDITVIVPTMKTQI